MIKKSPYRIGHIVKNNMFVFSAPEEITVHTFLGIFTKMFHAQANLYVWLFFTHTYTPTFSFWSSLFRFHSVSWSCFHITQNTLISSHCIIFYCIEKLFIQFPIAGYLLLHRMSQWISLDIAKIWVILKDGIFHILFVTKVHLCVHERTSI